jgi:uncharacterized protein YndB with AHSA1/START domain
MLVPKDIEVKPYKKLVFTWTWKSRPNVVELVTVLIESEKDSSLMTFERTKIDDGTTHNYKVK